MFPAIPDTDDPVFIEIPPVVPEVVASPEAMLILPLPAATPSPTVRTSMWLAIISTLPAFDEDDDPAMIVTEAPLEPLSCEDVAPAAT